MAAKGIRNNNPGNIEYSSNTKWQGLDSPPSDGRFCRFKSAIWGIRAIARTLITYFDKHGCDTVTKVINRWAPPSENKTLPYINFVAKRLGIGPSAGINLHDYRFLRPMVEAIIQFENGEQPYSAAQIDKALVLAGVEPEKKPISSSRTVVGTTVAATTGTAAQVIQETQAQLEPLVPYAEVIKWAFLLLALAGLAFTLYARWDDRRKGLR